MNLIVSSITMPWEEDPDTAIQKAFKICGLPYRPEQACIYKKSIDARHGKIKIVYSVQIFCPENVSYRESSQVRVRRGGVEPNITGTKKFEHPPVIAGFGPAGLFAAYFLAKKGYRPIIFERGSAIEERDQDIDNFVKLGNLNTESNFQFGEGGAGTYSDGKLTTRINDPACETVLDLFVRFGAPLEIKNLAKPHIGTDILKNIVKNIRQEIIHLGGNIHFKSPLTGIKMQNGILHGVEINGDPLACECLVLAIGHSARDTFMQIFEQGIQMQPKAFSVGVRIEHKQKDMNHALYGKAANHLLLPPAEYALSHRQADRAVYTFCMCPGGYVVPAQSEEYSIVTNGMSYHARNGENANSAMVVSVGPSDFPDLFGGITFQRQLEHQAYELTGSYRAPSQTVGDFLNEKQKGSIVDPTYALGIEETDLHQLFPSFICDMLEVGFHEFSKKIKIFNQPGARLTGPETRTSSPIRIIRGDDLFSTSVQGMIPCGEGAGYAGGIMSAAVDGIRAAERIMSIYKPF